MPAPARPPAVSLFQIGAVICAAGILLSMPFSVGPAFTKIAAQKGVTLSASTRLFFSAWSGVPIALASPAMLGFAWRIRVARPRTARWLAGLAVLLGIAAACFALMGLTDLFFPPQNPNDSPA